LFFDANIFKSSFEQRWLKADTRILNMTSVLTANQRATLNSQEFMRAVTLKLKSNKDYRDSEGIIIVPLNDLVFAAGIYSKYFKDGARKAYSAHFNGKAFAAVLPFSESDHNHEVFNLEPTKSAANTRKLFGEASKRKSIVLAHNGQPFTLMLTYGALEKELASSPR
jgi:hypothetical protein